MQYPLTPSQQSRKTYYTIAFIFALITTIITGFFLITLIWTIPMTLMIYRAQNEVGSKNEKPHLVLGICALLFLGIISGIFILLGHFSYEGDTNFSSWSNNNNNNNNSNDNKPTDKDDKDKPKHSDNKPEKN